MKRINLVTCMLIGLFCTNFVSGQSSVKITDKDFQLFTGSWQGKLSYMDYSTNKPYSMPANIDISRIGSTKKYMFYNSFPDEPKANSTDTVIISGDGKKINMESVKSKQLLDNGNLEIVTEINGVDGNANAPAIIRHTYIVGKEELIIRKDIQFIGQDMWLQRHEYYYKRKL